MRFVEETGGAWTAEQLKQAEAEIELQKKEWEANRLAAVKKEEEEELKRMEDENEIITYSSEDAKNQVNNKSKKPVNKRISVVKSSYKNKNNKKLLGKRKFQQPNNKNIASKNRQVVVVSKRIKRENIKSKRKLRNSTTIADNNKSNLLTRKTARGSINNISLHDDTNNSFEDVSNTKENIVALGHNSDFDSECSLDVMVDSNDAHNSDSNQTNCTDDEIASTDDDSANDSSDGLPNSKNKELSANHIDVNSPRTRSRGSVQINLWTLDVSPILPGVKPVKNAQSSKNKTKSDDESEEHDPLEITTEDLMNNESDIDDEKPLINHVNKKQLKTPVILDGFASNNSTTSNSKKKIARKKFNNGNKQPSLDGWLKPKIVLSKIKVPDSDHIIASDYANSSRITRRQSIFKTNPENGPS